MSPNLTSNTDLTHMADSLTNPQDALQEHFKFIHRQAGLPGVDVKCVQIYEESGSTMCVCCV